MKLDYENTVLSAKVILADMFDIHIQNFEHNVSRVRDVVEARRFLTYFMVKELGIRYNAIKKYVPALGNHATAIHHFKRVEWYLEDNPNSGKPNDPYVHKMYNRFLDEIFSDEKVLIEKEIEELVEQRTQIGTQIRKLRSIIQ